MNKNSQHTGDGRKKNSRLWILVIVGAILLAGCIWIIFNQINGAKEKNDVEQENKVSDNVKLGEYNGIKVSLEVTQEDIDAEIESLQEEYTEYEQLSGTVADGDLVYAKFEGYVNGIKMDATCGSDYVEIGSGEWLEGFESSLLGASTGENIKFTVNVPEGSYGDEFVDGHDVEFHAKVKYICGEEIVPEYKDAFVQSISKYNTVEEHKESLRQSIAKDYEENRGEYVWTEVLEVCKVVKYPDDLLEEARQEVLQGYYDMAEMYGSSKEDLFISFGYEGEEDFKENALEELAEDTAAEYLIADAIAEKEGIQWSEDAYQEILEEEYSYMTEEYESQDAFETANKTKLERLAQMGAVKEWLAERAEYTY